LDTRWHLALGGQSGRGEAATPYRLRPVIDLADLQIRVLVAAHAVPPAVDVVGEGAGADLAEAVELGDVFDFNDGAHAFEMAI